MRILYRLFLSLLVLFFILSNIWIAYQLYTFDTFIVKELHITDTQIKSTLDKKIFELEVFVGVSLVFGFLSILLLSLNRKTKVINFDRSLEKGLEKTNSVDTKKIDNQLDVNKFEQALSGSAEELLAQLCKTIDAAQGAIYLTRSEGDKNTLELVAGYAFYLPESKKITYEFGEGLIGQVAKSGKLTVTNAIPKGYIEIASGLGNASPNSVIIAPLKDNNDQIIGILEVATFDHIDDQTKHFVEHITQLLGKKIKNN